MPKTLSEKLLEEYFIEKGLTAEKNYFYEPDLGKPEKIDFLVKDINTLFEVTEFSKDNDQDNRILGTQESKTAVRLDPYQQVRNKIDEKRKQFKPYKEDYTCVLVLHQGDSIVAGLETELLAGAIFGDISMGFSNEGGYTHTFFGRNAALKTAINTTFSAVAVIQEIFPNRKMAASEFWKANNKDNLSNLNMGELTKVYENWSKSAGYDLEKRVVALRVIFNPFARRSMGPEFFTGQLDELFSIDESGRFRQQK